MSYNPNYPSQNGNPAYNKRGQKKESPVNKLEFTGIVRPRKAADQQVTIKELPSGSATAKFQLECSELTGTNDEQGNPKVSKTFVPVSVWSNKNINVAMLRSIVPGMKVHVVGRWVMQHFKGQDGSDQRFVECSAYVVEILEAPQVMQYPGYQPQGAPYGQQPMAPQYPGYQPQGAPAPVQPQYPGYQPQGAPYGQQPMAPQYPGYQPQGAPAPAQPQYPGYQPQNGQQAAQQQNAQQGRQIPPYYQPAQAPMPPAQAAPSAPAGMPSNIPGGTIEV